MSEVQFDDGPLAFKDPVVRAAAEILAAIEGGDVIRHAQAAQEIVATIGPQLAAEALRRAGDSLPPREQKPHVWLRDRADKVQAGVFESEWRSL
jgi:hypothetical protein